MKNEDKVEKHPSYGLFTISRVQGSINLFGSPIDHGQFIRLAVHRAENRENELHIERQYPYGSAIVEVDMSAAQFAQAITSFNDACGTPCTIAYIDGKRQPPCPKPVKVDAFRKHFRDDVEKAVENVTDLISEATKVLSNPTIKKAERVDLLARLKSIEMELTSKLPYLNDLFIEATEKTVHQAKCELESAQQQMVTRLGLANLDQPKLLEG